MNNVENAQSRLEFNALAQHYFIKFIEWELEVIEDNDENDDNTYKKLKLTHTWETYDHGQLLRENMSVEEQSQLKTATYNIVKSTVGDSEIPQFMAFKVDASFDDKAFVEYFNTHVLGNKYEEDQ